MNNKILYVITAVWVLFFIGTYALGLFERPTTFNELGDFLAGVFAPLGFLWLIYGYRQQGKQLEQNTKALEQQEKALQLQIDEMREGVRQQSELVKIHNLELTNKYISSKPFIICKPINGEVCNKKIAEGNWNYLNLNIILHNEGRGEAKFVAINSETCHLEFIRKVDINKDYHKNLIFRENDLTIIELKLYSYFTVTYTDIYQNEYTQHFELIGTMMDDTLGSEQWEFNIVPHL